jgi:hypothetical protein
MYVEPTITDYGDVLDVTAAIDDLGPEDGASKAHPGPPHHS